MRLRVRLYLALEAVFLLTAGTHVILRRNSLPYGNLWPAGAACLFLLSLVPLERLVRHHVRVRRLRTPYPLRLGADQLARKRDHTYLGEGFVWGARETGRLQELSAAGIGLPEELQSAVGGDWLIHGLGAGEKRDLFLPDRLLNQHLFLMGAPGSGKTRGLEVLIEQAVRRGDAVVVIDPKGDEGLLDRTYDSAVRHSRRKKFRVFALPYPQKSARYNPLQCFVSPSDVADRICSIMPKQGEGEAFRNFAWQFVSIVATAIDRVQEGVSLAKLENYCFHNPSLLVRSMIGKLCPEIPPSPDFPVLLNAYRQHCVTQKKSFVELDRLIAMATMDREYFGKVSGALRTILAKFTSSRIGHLFSPEDLPSPRGLPKKRSRSEFSWEDVDRKRLVVYFFLGSLMAQDSASATARLCLSDLASYVGRKYAFHDASGFAKRRLTVVVDEVADALAPESVNILNKARGAGLSLVMAGQSLADLEIALGSAADARRALANVGSFLTLRAANPEDGKFFAEKAGLRTFPVVTRGETYEPSLLSTGGPGEFDFAYRSSISSSHRSNSLLPAWALDRLGVGHYFGFWGGELRKGMLPLLEPPANLYSPMLKKGKR